MEFITLLALHHHQWSLGIKDANESGFFTVKPEISTHETNFPGSNFKELNSSKTGSRFDEIFIKVKDVNPIIVEYEGQTYQDYPDPESNDPKYAGQNTITG